MFLKCWVMQVFYMYIDTSSHNQDIIFNGIDHMVIQNCGQNQTYQLSIVNTF